MPRKKEIMVSRVGGSKSKAEVFEELIWIVLGERVKLAPAPHKGQGQMIEGGTRP